MDADKKVLSVELLSDETTREFDRMFRPSTSVKDVWRLLRSKKGFWRSFYLLFIAEGLFNTNSVFHEIIHSFDDCGNIENWGELYFDTQGKFNYRSSDVQNINNAIWAVQALFAALTLLANVIQILGEKADEHGDKHTLASYASSMNAGHCSIDDAYELADISVVFGAAAISIFVSGVLLHVLYVFFPAISIVDKLKNIFLSSLPEIFVAEEENLQIMAILNAEDKFIPLSGVGVASCGSSEVEYIDLLVDEYDEDSGAWGSVKKSVHPGILNLLLLFHALDDEKRLRADFPIHRYFVFDQADRWDRFRLTDFGREHLIKRVVLNDKVIRLKRRQIKIDLMNIFFLGVIISGVVLSFSFPPAGAALAVGGLLLVGAYNLGYLGASHSKRKLKNADLKQRAEDGVLADYEHLRVRDVFGRWHAKYKRAEERAGRTVSDGVYTARLSGAADKGSVEYPAPFFKAAELSYGQSTFLEKAL